MHKLTIFETHTEFDQIPLHLKKELIVKFMKASDLTPLHVSNRLFGSLSPSQVHGLIASGTYANMKDIDSILGQVMPYGTELKLTQELTISTSVDIS